MAFRRAARIGKKSNGSRTSWPASIVTSTPLTLMELSDADGASAARTARAALRAAFMSMTRTPLLRNAAVFNCCAASMAATAVAS